MPKKKLPEIDPTFAAFLNDAGITNIRLLPTGEYAGLQRYMFTTGLMVGLIYDPFDVYKTRYCYHNQLEARKALESWDGQGDPPGNWIKQKPEDRVNPNYIKPEEVETISSWLPSAP